MDIFHNDSKPDSISYEKRIYDQVLMQEIADETDGVYYYLDVGSLGAGIPAAALDANESLANRLADSYVAANESMKKRQRLDGESQRRNRRSELHWYSVRRRPSGR